MLRKREITKQYETTKITVRVERRKTKTESFKHKNRSRQFSLCTVIFAIIAKNTGIAKIEIFAMHGNFRYDSKNSLA